MWTKPIAALTLGLTATTPLYAQSSMQACRSIADNAVRLACFDAAVAPASVSAPAPTPATAQAPAQTSASASAAVSTPSSADSTSPSQAPPSHLERFWELRADTQRDPFTLHTYRANYLLPVVSSNAMNRQPSSPAPGRTPATAVPYGNTEVKFQLSLRTKVAQDVLLPGASLWAAYTQTSSWQLWSRTLSAPFRSTDYEPEMIYMVPMSADLPFGWRLRYGQAGVVHQSNGQGLPLSRSWNRVYAGAGIENGNWSIATRLWARLREPNNDDNPGIERFVGRGELTLRHSQSGGHVASLRLRHTLSASARGSALVDYAFPLGSRSVSGVGALRGHVQLFTGYGQTLLDYNFRQTTVGLGLSLADW